MKTANPSTTELELTAKRRRRAKQSRARMIARGINLNAWHAETKRQLDEQKPS